MSASLPAEQPPLNRVWPLRVAVGAWLFAGLVGVWFLPDISPAGSVVIGGLWLVGLGVLLREFIASLFGPVLAYDLLRTGRRKRTFWTRGLYAAAMAVLFAWIYMTWYSSVAYRGTGMIQPTEMAKLAEIFFVTYMVVQFILVCLLTPGSVANSITDEKERRTIEFMLATDLRDREILFGKFASRVGSLLFFLMAGLPILSMVQFFGGIDPDQVMAGFAATVITVLSVSAVAMAASVLSRKSRDAIALTYLIGLAYSCLSAVAIGLGMAATRAGELIDLGFGVIGWDDLAYPLACGNPFFMVPYLLERRGGTTQLALFNGTLHYLLFHLTIFVLFLGWAGLRLRSIALAQTFGGSSRWFRRRGKGESKTSPSRIRIASSRPDMGNSPILWKEIFIESGFKMGLFAKLIIVVLVLASFAPVFMIAVDTLLLTHTWRSGGPWWSLERWRYFSEGVNVYVRVLSPVISAMIFLAIAIRGAGTVLGERDRHSLDVLLTTPLPANRILWGKWWGCLLGMRWAWAWLGSIWLIGLASGGVAPIMLPAMIVSAAVYAGGFAWIGIFCSVTMKNSLLATVTSIALSVVAGGGYFLVFLFCCVMPISLGGGGSGREFDILIDILSGFSPPVNMAWLPIFEFDSRELTLTDRDIPYAPFWLFGLLAWAGLSWLVSTQSLERFRKMANRLPMSRNSGR